MKSPSTVTIVGAGMSGPLMAIFLARRGFADRFAFVRMDAWLARLIGPLFVAALVSALLARLVATLLVAAELAAAAPTAPAPAFAPHAAFFFALARGLIAVVAVLARLACLG